MIQAHFKPEIAEMRATFLFFPQITGSTCVQQVTLLVAKTCRLFSIIKLYEGKPRLNIVRNCMTSYSPAYIKQNSQWKILIKKSLGIDSTVLDGNRCQTGREFLCRLTAFVFLSKWMSM